MKDEQIVIKADKKYRKKILLIALILVILGFVLLTYFRSRLTEISILAENSPETAIQNMKRTFFIIFMIMFIFGLGLCLYLFKLGRSIIESRQFPPPGIKVLRNIKLETGEKAKAKGKLLQVLSVLFLMLSVIIPLLVFLALRNL